MKQPKTAYILLWFPKPSETFIFREVVNLQKMGLPLHVYTLYGKLHRGLSAEMQSASDGVERLGVFFLKKAHRDLLRWWKKDRKKVIRILKSLLVKPYYGLEKTGENLWAFLCAFHLARRFQEQRIQHIHAPWASGPATAAWIASQLTGIPFSFTARAWDIHPPDGALKEKIRDAAFIRSETHYNIGYLAQFAGGDTGKIHLTYNGVPLKAPGQGPVPMTPPYRLLALGRFVRTKGYDYLIHGCRILKESGLDFHLVLAGDGPKKRGLQRLTKKLGLGGRVSFPGFITHDRVSDIILSTDIFIMPSVVHATGDRDGIPTVIMESLLHRIPVIATAVAGIPEVIKDGMTGLLIPEKDPFAISQAVRRLAGDRKSALEMAEKGRALVQRNFDTKRNHRKIMELYHEKVVGLKGPMAKEKDVRNCRIH
ncbi:MAG: glycosyltransferase family 4 protein [Deltaproteobacteria bacterium]|nr:glycosyltransferase family 4 protein [Deltaproteobacteria bacterium]